MTVLFLMLLWTWNSTNYYR